MSLTPSPENPNDAAWARPLFERQITMLGVLAEAGLEVALDAKDRATSAKDVPSAQAAATAYGRAARAVRLSLALQARLIRELQAWDRTQARLAAFDTGQAAGERQAQVERIVERIALSQHEDDPDEVERLVEEAGERLEREDEFGSLLSRTVSEWVELICRDLDLTPDWPELAHDAWALEEQASGRVGEALAAHLTKPFSPPSKLTNLEAAAGPADGEFLHRLRASGAPKVNTS